MYNKIKPRESIMKFNFLLPKHLKTSNRVCERGSECYWIPTGIPRATAGDNIAILLECKHCERKESVFLTREQYELFERQVQGSVPC